MMHPTTQRVLLAIDEYMQSAGWPPTFKEIMRRAELSTTSVVGYHLDKLEDLHCVQRGEKGAARGIRLTPDGKRAAMRLREGANGTGASVG